MRYFLALGIMLFSFGFSNNILSQSSLLDENFNDCNLPNGWSLDIERGINDWQFGEIDNGNAWASNNMDGTCMVYFDDDGLGEEAVSARARLSTPIFDGSKNAQITLSFDLIFRKYADLEHVAVYVIADGVEHNVVSLFEQFGGEQFNEYERMQVDLSRYRGEEMQVSFVYDDGNMWGWWVGLDNVAIMGEGELADDCVRAVELFAGESCVSAEHTFALQNEFESVCGMGFKSLWYSFNATESGWFEVKTETDFNDIVHIYSGVDCNQLSNMRCQNDDEYGFEGEKALFEAEAGQNYFFRVSAMEAEFGKSVGTHCIRINEVANDEPVAVADECANAISLNLNADCRVEYNVNATTSDDDQYLNRHARHDIWYAFEMDNRDVLIIESQADFANSIAVYSGSCGDLVLADGNERGHELELEGLAAGNKYFIQVSGFFSSLKGQLCLRTETKDISRPTNDLCQNPQSLTLNGDCNVISNQFASSDEDIFTSCNASAENSIWYTMLAPSSGQVFFKGESDFPFSVTVFSGNCQEMEEIGCLYRPDGCSANNFIGDLVAGERYLVMITSHILPHGPSNGEVCLKAFSKENYIPNMPLTVEVGEVCESPGKGTLTIDVAGGSGNYLMSGFGENDDLVHLQEYTLLVRDNETGCEKSISEQFFCPPDDSCQESNLSLTAVVECDVDDDGQQMGTGRLIQTTTGGLTPYSYYGPTANGASLANGDYYQIAMTDANGCGQVVEGIFYCAPSSNACAGVTMGVELDIICAYDKFGELTGELIVQYEVFGGFGTVDVVGLEQGGKYKNGDEYVVELTDENGCVEIIVGVLECRDVRPKPDLNVNLESLEAFPNPTESFTTIVVESAINGLGEVEMLDMNGRVIESFQFQFVEGTNKILLNLQEYVQNVYLASINQGGERHFLRIIKS